MKSIKLILSHDRKLPSSSVCIVRQTSNFSKLIFIFTTANKGFLEDNYLYNN